MAERFLGIDIGTETIKLVQLARYEEALRATRREIVEHGNAPGPLPVDLLRDWRGDNVTGAAVTGRGCRQVALPRVPTKQAQVEGFALVHGSRVGTIVSIGSHDSRCSSCGPTASTCFERTPGALRAPATSCASSWAASA